MKTTDASVQVHPKERVLKKIEAKDQQHSAQPSEISALREEGANKEAALETLQVGGWLLY